MGYETECPTCNAYIPIDDEPREGELIYCSYCGAQLMIKVAELKETEDESKIEVEEEYN